MHNSIARTNSLAGNCPPADGKTQSEYNIDIFNELTAYEKY
jgi:hypothetical protein